MNYFLHELFYAIRWLIVIALSACAAGAVYAVTSISALAILAFVVVLCGVPSAYARRPGSNHDGSAPPPKRDYDIPAWPPWGTKVKVLQASDSAPPA